MTFEYIPKKAVEKLRKDETFIWGQGDEMNRIIYNQALDDILKEAVEIKEEDIKNCLEKAESIWWLADFSPKWYKKLYKDKIKYYTEEIYKLLGKKVDDK